MRLKIFFRFRIRTKVFIAFLGLSLISLLIFGYIAFTDMKKLGQYALDRSNSLGKYAVNDSIEALKKQAEEYLLQLAEDQAAISNALLEKVKDEVSIVVKFASNLWEDPAHVTHKKSYSQEEKPEDIYANSVYKLAPSVSFSKVQEELELSGGMDEIFIPVYSNDRNIDTICLGTETGIFRSYPWRAGRAHSYDPRKRSWYKKAAKEEKTIWTEPYIHAATKELIITCAKPFYDKYGGLQGVVEADVTLKVLNNRIMSTQIGDLGYAFLIDSEGNIIARPGLNAGDTRWDETYKTESLLKSDNIELRKIIEEMLLGKKGISICEFEGGAQAQKYIAYAPLTATNWFLGIVMPVEEIIAPALATEKKIVAATKNTSRYINKQIKKVLKVLVITFIIIILFILLLDYRISKKITRPVLSLRKGAKIVGSGNLDYRLNIKTGDEIEDLADTFNKMTDSLKEYMKNLKDTTAVKERMESELKIAHDIQMGILPKKFPPFPDREEFDIYAVLRPAREVGGDFYDFFFIDKRHLCFVIGDVSGKGVPAALFMTMVKILIKVTAQEVLSPREVITKVNKELCSQDGSGLFITIFCGILDVETGEVLYVNGGHNPPIIIRKDTGPEYLNKPGSTIVGAFSDVEFNEEKLILNSGDSIYMYTDGVTEAFDKEHKQFTKERLETIIHSYKNESIEKLISKTLHEIKGFSESVPQSDDITILVLRYFLNITSIK